MFATEKKTEADLGPTDHLRWSSLSQCNIKRSFGIDEEAPT